MEWKAYKWKNFIKCSSLPDYNHLFSSWMKSPHHDLGNESLMRTLIPLFVVYEVAGFLNTFDDCCVTWVVLKIPLYLSPLFYYGWEHGPFQRELFTLLDLNSPTLDMWNIELVVKVNMMHSSRPWVNNLPPFYHQQLLASFNRYEHT